MPKKTGLILFAGMAAIIVSAALIVISLGHPSPDPRRNKKEADTENEIHATTEVAEFREIDQSITAPRIDEQAPHPFSDAPREKPRLMDPRHEQIESLRSEAAFKARSKDYSEAIEILEKAIEIDGKNELLKREMSQLYAAMGWSSYVNNDLRRARGFFEEALYYWPENENAVRGVAYTYFRENDRERAEEWLNFYIELGGDRPEVFSLMGRILYESDRTEDALSYLEKSLAASPEQPKIVELVRKIRRELQVEAGFYQSETSHFVIRYEGREVPGVSRVVMVICEEAYLMAGRKLGYYPDGPIPVILYTDEQFQDVTRSPAWAGAIFDGKIRIPAKGLRQRTEALERIIFHEYTHAVVHYVTQGRAPIWLHEGLAMSSEETPIDPVSGASKIIAGHGPAPLKSLEGSFMSMPLPKAELAYIESKLAVDYLYNDYGPFAVRELLRLLSEGENIGPAITELTAREYETFDREFQMWVRGLAGG
jgi:tetratricopeptide (TPR) repeat protein